MHHISIANELLVPENTCKSPLNRRRIFPFEFIYFHAFAVSLHQYQIRCYQAPHQEKHEMVGLFQTKTQEITVSDKGKSKLW